MQRRWIAVPQSAGELAHFFHEPAEGSVTTSLAVTRAVDRLDAGLKVAQTHFVSPLDSRERGNKPFETDSPRTPFPREVMFGKLMRQPSASAAENQSEV